MLMRASSLLRRSIAASLAAAASPYLSAPAKAKPLTTLSSEVAGGVSSAPGSDAGQLGPGGRENRVGRNGVRVGAGYGGTCVNVGCVPKKDVYCSLVLEGRRSRGLPHAHSSPQS